MAHFNSTHRNSIFRRTGLLLVATMFLLSLTMACAKKQAAPQPTNDRDALHAPPPMLQHTVKYSGETLGLISSWYTGDSKNYRQILEANPGLRPERIRIGMVVNIPQSLVIKETPLPEKMVRKSPVAPAKSGDEVSVTNVDSSTTDGSSTTPTNEVSGVSPDTKSETAKSAPETTDSKKAADDAMIEEALKAGGSGKTLEKDKSVGKTEDAAPEVGKGGTSKTDSESKDAAKKEPERKDTGKAAPEDSERERLLDELLQQ